MEKVKAELKYLRMSPEKVKIVARELRGKKIEEALVALRFLDKKAAHPLAKLIESASANAENNFGLKKDGLEIFKIEVLKGPIFKRWRPRSRGMANRIAKRTTHLKLYLIKSGAGALEEKESKKDNLPQKPGKKNQKKQTKNGGKPKDKKQAEKKSNKTPRNKTKMEKKE